MPRVLKASPAPSTMHHALLAFVALGLAACSAASDPEPEASHLTYFGFVGVACGDDFSDEVAGFTNVGTVCAPDPSVAGLVADHIDALEGRGIETLLGLEDIFFEARASESAPYGGPALRLRPDYAARWDALARDAELVRRASSLAAVFVADEPTWRGIPPDELATAYATVRATLPDTPLLLVEAYPVLPQLVVPEVVDWVAFDRYGVLDPNTDADYLADLAVLKAQRSRPEQRVLLVMETQWLPGYAEFGVRPEDLASVAESYHRLAQRDTSVLGIVGYLWPGASDDDRQLGARDLPASVQQVYRRIGQSILR